MAEVISNRFYCTEQEVDIVSASRPQRLRVKMKEFTEALSLLGEEIIFVGHVVRTLLPGQYPGALAFGERTLSCNYWTSPLGAAVSPLAGTLVVEQLLPLDHVLLPWLAVLCGLLSPEPFAVGLREFDEEVRSSQKVTVQGASCHQGLLCRVSSLSGVRQTHRDQDGH